MNFNQFDILRRSLSWHHHWALLMLSEGDGEFCLVYNETAQSVIISCITQLSSHMFYHLGPITFNYTRVECYSNDEGGSEGRKGGNNISLVISTRNITSLPGNYSKSGLTHHSPFTSVTTVLNWSKLKCFNILLLLFLIISPSSTVFSV